MTQHASSGAGVVVTGAARGLGAAIARRFAEGGHTVVGVDILEAVRQTMADLPGTHHAVVGDVGDADVMRAACEAASSRGGLRAIVLNAGVTGPGASASYPLEEWDRVVGVNLRAPFVGAKVAREFLSEGGSIVMLSSIAASQGFAERASYCASKAGVDGLVRSLAMEWGPDGLRVNAVAPGTISTELQAAMVASGRASIDGYLARVPLGRIGEPSDIAEAAYFLASPAAAYISGVVLPVDGGWAAAGLSASP